MMTIEPNPSSSAEIHEKIRQRLSDARRILIVSHIRPDGDAVGSVLGLGLPLMKAGKEVRMVLADGVPQNFRSLPGSEMIHRGVSAETLPSYDLTVTVDASDLQRVGGVLAGRAPDLNIDHHVTNQNFGDLNLVLPDRVATAAILAEFLPVWGLSLDVHVASVLLSGIVTDTIGFRTSNMNPQALRLSAMLMELGANLPDLYLRGLVSKSFEAGRYWGMGLAKLQREEIVPPGKDGARAASEAQEKVLIWTSLTLEDRLAAQYPGNDDADLVNILSTIESDIAVIFVEQKNGHVKISWRARPGYDVSQIALKFGGGGHPAAAGADIPGKIEVIQPQVLEATRAMLAQAENQVT